MRRTLLLTASTSTAVLLSVTAAAPALAADEVQITNRETVQAYLTPTGKVKVARLYDQVTATGTGSVDVENPVGTDGLRNLDGLSGPEVKDGSVVTRIDVDGEQRLRTVSEFDEDDLPVQIKATYELDGKIYDDPEDMVGRSGTLKVSYRVENTTSEPTSLTVKDGEGNDVQREVEVPLPLVGSLVTVLPKGFYSVSSDQATISGDGRGGTRMTFTMTLLPPVGAPVAEFGYTAQVRDVYIPKATVSIAVVQPLKNPSLATAAASYQGGATTGATLAEGAQEIDANLLKLRDGAGQLLGGLIQLRDGANELNAGLAGEAAPGANRLADGAGQAAAGASRLAAGAGDAATGAGDLATGLERAKTGSDDLADGLGRLAAGNERLANGFSSPTGDPDLITGSQDLASGLGLISGGLATLAGVEGLPNAAASVLTLRNGVDRIVAGLGSANQAGTILNGLAQLSAGNTQLQGGVTALRAGGDQLAAGLPTAKGGVDQVRAGLAAALAPGGSIDGLRDGVTLARSNVTTAQATPACAGDITAACQTATGTAAAILTAVLDGIEGATGLRAQTTGAVGGLGQVSTGLGGAIAAVGTGPTPAATTLRGGLAQVSGGLAQSATGLAQLTTGVTQVRAGLSNPACNTADPTNAANPCGLREGLTLLSNGLLTAVSGVTQLSAGAVTAATGSGTLAQKIAEAGAGAAQLAAGSSDAEVGSRQLADGLGTARDGSARLADGNQKIADGSAELAVGNRAIAVGAGDLAAGLDDAADGSGQLADGLEEAAEGAPAIRDGAQRLSDEGSKKLIEAGNDTALDFGERFAIIEAMGERTKDGGLPFGAPAGATGSAAYSFELAAATNEGSRNVTRGLLAVGALGLGALVSTLLTRRFS